MDVREDGAVLLRERTADGVVRLTLNRPTQRNALSRALMAALQAELEAVAGDREARVVVIEGAGPAFCAGHDLRELRADGSPEALAALFAQCSRLMRTILELPQPVVAKVHGVASAAGCQLVATCDLAIAAETARFATPGVNIGLFCSTPMVALSRDVGRKAAMEMLLLGELVGAEEARRLGLVNRVVPEAELEAATAAVTARIVSKSALTLRMGKAAFYRQAELPVGEAYELAGRVMVDNMLAADAGEGIDAFLARREPIWRHR